MEVLTKTIDTTLSRTHFEQVRDILLNACGISLADGKEELVKARLTKRLRALNLKNYDEYLSYLNGENSKTELPIMVDVLTTNKTHFFRESQHFDFLHSQVIPLAAKQGRKLRFWSAGCSTGEEPYTLGISLMENLSDFKNWNIKILATDISPTVLAVAKNATYPSESLSDVPEQMQKKYFVKSTSDTETRYTVANSVRQMIKFAQLNLMGPWPMKGPFDVIFCRNVMIYFEKPTRINLVERYYSLLKPGGFLFVGHSESLTGTATKYKYVQPAIYMK